MPGFDQDKQKDVFPASERIAPTRALGGDAAAASGDASSGDADRADSSGGSVIEPAALKRSERPVIIGALCAALAVVVVACVFAFGSPSPTIDATAFSSSASQEQGAVSGEAAEKGDAQNEDTSDEESADHEAADESGEPTDEDGGASSGAASSYEGTTEPSSSSPSSAGGSGGSGESDAGSSAAAAPEPEPEPTPAPAIITVSVYIDSSRAHAYDSSWPSSMGGGTVTLAQGSSVYDALCAVGVSLGGSSSYVSSIGGLAEFSCGKGSGWMYSVNGVYPNKSCGKYQLSGGESILWVYTCDLGNDL